MEQNKPTLKEKTTSSQQQQNVTRKYETEPIERRELPPVVKEKIIKEEVYEVQPIIYRTVIRPEIRRIEKPIHQRVLAPIQNSTQTLPAIRKNAEIRGDIPSKYQELLLDPKYENQEIIRVELPPIMREVVKSVTIQEVQPVIQRSGTPASTETVQTQLSKVTISETHKNTSSSM